MGYHVDSTEQRERARRAEQRLLQHSMERTPKRPSRYTSDREYPPDDADGAPPPVFKVGGQFLSGRDPSTAPEKYARRFRDGLPPPPPPETLAPQVLRPAGQAALLPQEYVDRGRAAPQPTRFPENGTGYPQPDPWPEDDEDRAWEAVEAHRLGIVLDDAGTPPLSRSQKKRLARKRAKERQAEQVFDPTPPSPTSSPDRLRCDARATVRFPDGTTATVTCPLTPFPHPGQPHIVRLQADEEGADVFVGFWLPGE